MDENQISQDDHPAAVGYHVSLEKKGSLGMGITVH